MKSFVCANQNTLTLLLPGKHDPLRGVSTAYSGTAEPGAATARSVGSPGPVRTGGAVEGSAPTRAVQGLAVDGEHLGAHSTSTGGGRFGCAMRATSATAILGSGRTDLELSPRRTTPSAFPELFTISLGWEVADRTRSGGPGLSRPAQIRYQEAANGRR